MTPGFAEWSDAPQRARIERLKLHDARPLDAPRVNEIQVAAGRTEVNLERLIADADRHLLVAECDGRVLGWAAIHYLSRSDGLAGRGHYLAGVTVDPPERRRGVGLALTRARLDWIWERADIAWYFVNAQNTVSIALHENLGFELVGTSAGVHGADFSGGLGLIFRAERPHAPENPPAKAKVPR
ncbi:GNAT family N-acetyltransferase [Microbacterium lacus]|uniref:GNAT family N-acetyltransferase n=1 Tax=Microbacterium lacus TaxID=415217 RepID=UPI00384B6318